MSANLNTANAADLAYMKQQLGLQDDARRRLMASVYSGARHVTQLFIGDSTTLSKTAGSDGNYLGVWTRGLTGKYAAAMEALGYATTKDNWLGTGGGTPVTITTSDRFSPNMTFSGAWDATTITGLGGSIIRNNSTTEPFTQVVEKAFDTLEFIYWTSSGNATFTVSVGGVVVATINANAPFGPKRAVLRGLTAPAGTEIAWARTGVGGLLGLGGKMKTYMSSVPSLHIVNAGRAGWTAIAYAAVADQIWMVGADMIEINLAINDWLDDQVGDPAKLDAFEAAYITLGTQSKRCALTRFWMPTYTNPNGTGIVTPTAVQDQYRARILRAGNTLGIPVHDAAAALGGSYAAAAGAGYMGDQNHFNTNGAGAYANAVAAATHF